MLKPITQVFVCVKSAFTEELVTDSGLKFYIDPSYRKEWQVSVTGTIAALPAKVLPQYKKVFQSVSIGDEIAMSYTVVADFEFKSDAPNFMQVTEDNPHFREYVNAKDEWLRVYALPGKISKVWVGIYQDRNRNIISGVRGSESQMERWLSQFPIGKTDIYTFRNLFSYNGTDYWKCGLDDIFAKKIKGHWQAVGDRVICKPVEEVVPEKLLIKEHRGQDVRMRYQDRGMILTGGKDKGLKKGEVIGFNPRYLEKYTLDHKQYYLIDEKRVNGRWLMRKK
jgi:hypothetical protein